MRTPNSVSQALTASVALAMLAGCSGSSSPMTPTTAGQDTGASTLPVQRQSLHGGPKAAYVQSLQVTTPSFMDPAAVGKPLVFVADYKGKVVNIYLQGHMNKMVGQIAGLGGPADLTTDAAGNLYIADFLISTVPIYAPPYTGTPKLTLSDAGYLPYDVSVSPPGVVAVANECQTSSGCPLGSGTVSFYAKNSTTPCATVAAPPIFSKLWYDAFDDNGNLYIAGQYRNGSQNVGVIGEVKGGCSAKKTIVLTTTNTIHTPSGIQIDKHDRIDILDGETIGTSTLYAYKPPAKGSLGSPVSTIPLTSPYATTAFAFVKSGASFYTSETNFSTSFANEYDYPAGGATEDTIDVSGFAAGVAVTPSLVP